MRYGEAKIHNIDTLSVQKRKQKAKSKKQRLNMRQDHKNEKKKE